MSASVNSVVLVGRLGKDPEVRVTQGGDLIVSFSVATSERWTKGGQKHERTDWHRVEMFGKSGEFVRDYCVKGSLVAVEGSVRYEEWTDKDGKKRHATKIRAQRVNLLAGGRPKDAQPEQAAFEATDDDVPF